jgi:hypothetical protein
MKANRPVRLEFDPDRKRISHCPFCGASNHDGKFSPYKGFDEYGHCFRCGETRSPFQKREGKSDNQPLAKVLVPASYLDFDVVVQSAGRYRFNILVQYLVKLVGLTKTNTLVSEYYLGTPRDSDKSNYVIFWQIDTERRVRSGKWMLYEFLKNPDSVIGLDCKRVKRFARSILWEHKQKEFPEFHFKSCLFGEHLLKKYPNKIVAVTESEKTALIAAAYFPDFVWLATGGLSNLTVEKCEALRGRTVVLFPDVNGYDRWEKLGNQLNAAFDDSQFSVSQLIRLNPLNNMTEGGYDLADYLIKYKTEHFESQE